jgi:hypothetical protein
MLRRVAFVRSDVSQELSASLVMVTRISELRAVPPKRRFLQEPHDVTSQKTPFFVIKSSCFYVSSFCLISQHVSAYMAIIEFTSYVWELCPALLVMC